jgi:ankyrin repeat protein
MMANEPTVSNCNGSVVAVVVVVVATGKKPTDLNIPDERGRTPLHIAALIGHVEIGTY